MDLSAVNYAAVVVAAAAAFFLGGLWYSPLLFAKPWVRAQGFDFNNAEQMAKLKQGRGPAFAGAIVAALINAFALAILMQRVQPVRVLGGIKTGVFVWFGFVMTVQLTGMLFGHRRKGVFAIDTAYQLACYVVMGAILGAWT